MKAMGTIDIRSSGFKKLGLLKEKLVELEKFIKQLTDFRDEAVALVCSSMDSYINKQEAHDDDDDSLAVDPKCCDLDSDCSLWDKVLDISLDAVESQTAVHEFDLLGNECRNLTSGAKCISDSCTRNISNQTSVGLCRSYTSVSTNTDTSHSNAATSTSISYASVATSTDTFFTDTSTTTDILHISTTKVCADSATGLNSSVSTVNSSDNTYTSYFVDTDTMTSSAKSNASNIDSGTSLKSWEPKNQNACGMRPIKLKLSKKSEEHPWKVRLSCTPRHVTIFDTDALEKELDGSSSTLSNDLELEYAAKDNYTSIETDVESVSLPVEPTEIKVQRQTRSCTSFAVHNKTKSIYEKNCACDKNGLNSTSVSQPKKNTKLGRVVKSLKASELCRTRKLSSQRDTASNSKLINSFMSSRKKAKVKNTVRCLKSDSSGVNTNVPAVKSAVQRQLLNSKSSKPCRSERNAKVKSLSLQLKKSASKKSKCLSLKKYRRKSNFMKTRTCTKPTQETENTPQSPDKSFSELFSSTMPCVVLHDILRYNKQSSDVISSSTDTAPLKTVESLQSQAVGEVNYSMEFIPFAVKEEPDSLSENPFSSAQEIPEVDSGTCNTSSVVSCFENFDENELSNDSYSKTYFKFIEKLTNSTNAVDSSP